MASSAADCATVSVDLSSSNCFDWTLSCTNDPLNSNIITNNLKYPATVPGTILSDLKSYLPDPFLGDNNLHPKFTAIEKASFSYHLTFDLPLALTLENTIHTSLVFDGLDTCATVFLNDVQLLTSDNAFHPHSITLPLNCIRRKANILRVDFSSIHSAIDKRPEHTYKEWNDPVGGISRVRSPQYVAGWDWGPRLLGCGIVRPVSIVFMPVARIVDVAYCQTFKKGDLFDQVDIKVIVNVAINSMDTILDKQIDVECTLIFNDNTKNTDVVTCCKCTLVEEDSIGELWNGGTGMNVGVRFVQFQGMVTVTKPNLWWPNGMGSQHMYTIITSLSFGEEGTKRQIINKSSTQIGLRDLKLIREPTPNLRMHSLTLNESNEDIIKTSDEDDKDGISESFVFSVNGRRFFSKGANYIPPRVLYATNSFDDYEDILLSARDAHMNMLRVWGGGVYESEMFYDLCDNLGILLWHDFMFSCSLYPGDEVFLKSCSEEAMYQVSRLRNRACMALWCGNNELEQVPHHILKTDETKSAYDQLFYNVLSEIVENDVGNVPYWPCSPHNPAGYEKGFNNAKAGDTHFWDVWHARKPVSAYLSHESRFCSEFGMQSYLSENGARRFTGNELNVYGPIMESHQKNANGNLIMMEYCQRLFRMAGDYSSLSYQSQLNQMICLRMGVEHFRRSWPYCGGALYWQLNDCWPCFSWSGIEYGGNWKALHNGAKLFFNPLLLSLVHHGKETVGVCNIMSLSEKTGVFSVFATYDGIDKRVETDLTWTVVDVESGSVVGDNQYQHHTLKQDTNCELAVIDINDKNSYKNPESIDARKHVLRVSLKSRCGKWESSATGWLCAPRHYTLPTPDVTINVVTHEVTDTSTKVKLEVTSNVFAPFCEIWIDESDDIEADLKTDSYVKPTRIVISENFFDVFPGENYLIEIVFGKPLSANVLKSRLRWRSLVQSYAQ